MRDARVERVVFERRARGAHPGAAAAAPGAKPASGDLFTETLTADMAGVQFDTSFNMVFVEGGTFTLGWEAGDASLRPENVDPVRNVTVSSPVVPSSAGAGYRRRS